MHIKTVASEVPLVDCFSQEEKGLGKRNQILIALKAMWNVWCRYTKDWLYYAIIVAGVVLVSLRILDWLC